MTMTDPIADYLTRIRNAQGARRASAEIPHSKFKVAISKILKEEGYINDFKVVDGNPGKTLTVTLKYDAANAPAIQGIKRVSKPGLRRYTGKTKLPQVLGGLGVAILSTSSGLMTDKRARNTGVGGEIVAFVW
ncbi:MAG: 30S ribosomal protein S8 [Candidatus Ancillula trichonymphae]|jgi:small subunit ribosomal protein S8|nr:30S ribosomal protein S8 [Candidatus Ancillula trichonymphae]